MENNHKPTPYSVAHYKFYSEIQSINGNHVCLLEQESQEDRIAVSSFIVTACNNYQSLKEENEELSTQLAKANSDKEKLATSLKHIRASMDKYGFETTANDITKTLQDCGITL